MKLANFWKNLPGLWEFERIISNNPTQTGFLNIEKAKDDFYIVHEKGIYKDNKTQTFFRDYHFCWQNNCLNIYGKNPKDGYVLLHSLSDTIKTHTHFCNSDQYQLELLNFGLNTWSTAIIITGPHKNMTLETCYRRRNS